MAMGGILCMCGQGGGGGEAHMANLSDPRDMDKVSECIASGQRRE